MSDIVLEFSRGDLAASNYEVIDRLGESPLGAMYRVKSQNTGEFLRLIALRPELGDEAALRAAFDRVRALEERHLLAPRELLFQDGQAFLTTEDFEGTTLRELIHEYKVQNKTFGVQDAAQVTLQILEGLKAAHEAGFVMRALRPEYVLVQVRYTGPRQANFVAHAKLVGLGFWDLVPSGTLAEDEFTRGAAKYLAPELNSFTPTRSPRLDIYSAGVIFYEMLTGTAPVGTFQAPTSFRRDLPPHVDTVIELAMGYAPEDRYGSVQDTIDDIRRIFQTTHQEAAPPSRSLVLPVGLVVGSVAVAALAVALSRSVVDEDAVSEQADARVRAEVKAQIDFPSREEIAKILEGHPENMQYIPAGPYISGRMHSEVDAPSFEPLAEVKTTGAYLIDLLEYPNSPGETPTSGVTFQEAEGLCEEQGKRLCTDDEWEKACKGPGNTVYAYGDYFDPDFCGDGLEDRGYPSGSRAECRSGWGVFDMSGSYREWTSTAPKGSDVRRIVKDGIRTQAARGTRCAYGTDESIGLNDSTMGFRCCQDVDAPSAD